MYIRALLVAWLLGSSTALIVDTIYGQVEGNTVTLDDGTVIHSYWGIPYARPPVDDLRFELPQTPQSWSGVLPVKTLPSACMQYPVGTLWMTHPGWTDFDEDCLNLNIFAPADLSGAPYAVMVWFHGGAYTSGANIQYPGHFLVAKGVVVVTVNYRLGSFGFLATPDGTVNGNMGLFDQSMALRFVRNNIANFGGDRNRVTIFGQSAGAGSTSLQMISPYSIGLYHQAIMESGTENNVWSLNYPGQEPEQYVYQMANQTNCSRPTDPEMVDCLKELPAGVVRRAQDVECKPGYFCQGYAPVVDGPGGFIPRLPIEMKDELGPEGTVPIISGITKDDGSFYTAAFIPEAHEGGFNSTQFEYYLKTRLIDIFAARLTEEQYNNVFEALRYNYAPYPYLDDLEGNRQAFNQIITDAAFGMSWDVQLKMNSEYNPNTYAFVEAFRGLNHSSLYPEWMGVPHMGELPYVWGYPLLLNNPAVRNDSGIFFDVIGWTTEDITMANYQMTLWANFGKFGDPTPEPVQAPFNDTMTTWEKFSWDDSLKVLWLDFEVETKTVYEQRDYGFWRDYIPYLAPVQPYTTAEQPKNPAGMFHFNSRSLRKATQRYVTDILQQRNIDVPQMEEEEEEEADWEFWETDWMYT